jgi:glycosyltransferase involved in cell wall biosynthesis
LLALRAQMSARGHTAMRLLFLTERYPPDLGGVAASAGRLSLSLAAIGHEVHVLTLTREMPAGTVDRVRIGDRLELSRFGQAKHLDFTLQQALTYLEFLHSREPFSAIWGHFVHIAGFLAAWLGRHLGRPSILAVRGNDLDRLMFPPGDFARLEWCLRHATRIVTVSADLAAKVRTLVDRAAVVLPNAVDTELFRPGPHDDELAARHGLKTGELLLGFSGELRAKKGLGFLLEALRVLRSTRQVRLLVIGAIRPGDQGEFERVSASLDLGGAVVVTGHLPDPADVALHLRLCDLFVLPSLWEGMPNSLLEAMACGVPVLASDAGGIPEVVTDGVNGLLIPRTHLHLLARRVDEWMALPPERRSAMAASGRRTIEARHSPTSERKALTELLAGLS